MSKLQHSKLMIINNVPLHGDIARPGSYSVILTLVTPADTLEVGPVVLRSLRIVPACIWIISI